MQIPTRRFNTGGVWNIVPLVCREDENHEHREGLLMSMGFIGNREKHPTARLRIERVDRQKFTCFVGKLDEFRNDSVMNGNAYAPKRVKYSCSDLEDLGRSSELLNKEQASVAVLETLAETGDLD